IFSRGAAHQFHISGGSRRLRSAKPARIFPNTFAASFSFEQFCKIHLFGVKSHQVLEKFLFVK
uniref:Uncharacterized protein n=1 Tax=Lutzomyia longipalpis TaxID=7200 RepID=A0A1B0CSU7_LUTLO